MKGKIFLSGGGDLNDSFQLDEIFFNSLQNDAYVLYVPVALNRDKIGFESCADWFSGIISAHVSDKDINFSMLLEKDEIPDLSNFSAIYFGGGNTFKLLSYVIKSGFDKKIKEYLENGGIVYGGSAGAIILGKDIRTVEEENDQNYLEYKGLNLLNNISIICHYEESLDKNIFGALNVVNDGILALKEDSGLIYDGKSFEKIGTIFSFDKDKKNIF